jgi:hypothetical protein
MARRQREIPDLDERTIAQYLKERIYATITGLAIVLVYVNGDVPHRADQVLFSLVIGVLGITAAGYLADIIAHVAVHKHFPTAAQQRTLLRIAVGAVLTVVVPVILLLGAVVGLIGLHGALVAATVVYLLTLAAIGYASVRRTGLTWWQQALALGALVLFGALVIGLQVLAHAA